MSFNPLQWATDGTRRRVFCPASRLEEMKLLGWSEWIVCSLIMVYHGEDPHCSPLYYAI